MLSVTDITTYNYCQRKLFINKVLGLKEPYKLSAIKGIILHRVIERIANKEGIGKDLLKDEIKNNHLQLKKFGQGLVDFFQETISWINFEEKLLKKHDFLTEQSLESSLLGLKGRIDLIKKYKGKRVVIEIKTGRAPPENEIWENHKLQLGSYIMLLKEEFPNINEAEVHYIKDFEVRNMIFNPFLEKKIEKMKKKIEKMNFTKTLPPITSEKSKCEYCGFKIFCYNKEKVKNRLEQIINQ